MGNSKWFAEFPASETEFLDIGESDHRPLVTFIAREKEQPRRMFYYDSRMTNKEGFKETVSRGWSGSGQTRFLDVSFSQRINRCRKQISLWKRSNRCNTVEKIQILRKRLDIATTSNAVSLQDTNTIKEELNQAYLEEEFFWKQKSRVMWLRARDRNTRYFHGIAKGKRVRNTINSIHDEDDVIQGGHRSIAQVAESYFQRLYASVGDPQNLYEQAS